MTETLYRHLVKGDRDPGGSMNLGHPRHDICEINLNHFDDPMQGFQPILQDI
jgi:hypothetical protein